MESSSKKFQPLFICLIFFQAIIFFNGCSFGSFSDARTAKKNRIQLNFEIGRVFSFNKGFLPYIASSYSFFVPIPKLKADIELKAGSNIGISFKKFMFEFPLPFAIRLDFNTLAVMFVQMTSSVSGEILINLFEGNSIHYLILKSRFSYTSRKPQLKNKKGHVAFAYGISFTKYVFEVGLLYSIFEQGDYIDAAQYVPYLGYSYKINFN